MTPEQIKKWLKETGKTRHWLAEKCGVSKTTVDGWMSNRPIPKQASTMIATLMHSGASLSPKFTLDQFGKIQQKAKSEGMSVEEWITKVIAGALLIAAMTHFFRSPSDWSPSSMLATGKAGLEIVKVLF